MSNPNVQFLRAGMAVGEVVSDQSGQFVVNTTDSSLYYVTDDLATHYVCNVMMFDLAGGRFPTTTELPKGRLGYCVPSANVPNYRLYANPTGAAVIDILEVGVVPPISLQDVLLVDNTGKRSLYIDNNTNRLEINEVDGFIDNDYPVLSANPNRALGEEDAATMRDKLSTVAKRNITVNVPVNAWTDSAPYTQTVPLLGIDDSMEIIADISIPDISVFATNSVASVPGQWESVCYGAGMFVAVASAVSSSSLMVMASPDGVNWTSYSDSRILSWKSVCYGGGLFVAVANSGTAYGVMTSTTGTSWARRTSAADLNWSSVCYGDGLYVAVSSDGVATGVMTSPDGITWTLGSGIPLGSWRSVCYGNGLFVAVADSGANRVMTSPDGITWTARSAPNANPYKSVCYGDGMFVAVASSGSGSRIMTSTDGITWVSSYPDGTYACAAVCYGNGLYVVVSSNHRFFLHSYDGVTWRTGSTGAQRYWSSVCFGDGKFVGVSTNAAATLSTFVYEYNTNHVDNALDSWDAVDKLEFDTNTLHFTCYDKRPTVSMDVNLKILS